MALIIEDGSGVPGANSYVTEAEALAFLTERQLQAKWNTLNSSADREAKLIQAADFLNTLQWRGAPYDYRQTMALPRTWLDGIPTQVKSAQIMLALQAVDGPLTPAVAGPLIKKERKKLDGVGEKETEYAQPLSTTPIYAFLDGLIGWLLQVTPGSSIQVARRWLG